jgi:hypothetical protein
MHLSWHTVCIGHGIDMVCVGIMVFWAVTSCGVVGCHLQHLTVSQPRTPQSASAPPWTPQISRFVYCKLSPFIWQAVISFCRILLYHRHTLRFWLKQLFKLIVSFLFQRPASLESIQQYWRLVTSTNGKADSWHPMAVRLVPAVHGWYLVFQLWWGCVWVCLGVSGLSYTCPYTQVMQLVTLCSLTIS